MSNLRHLLQLLILSAPSLVTGFSASPQPSFLDGISSFFNTINKQNNAGNELQTKRQTLKTNLLDLCQDKNAIRGDIEDIMEQLREVQPFADTATSPLLQKEWLL